MPSKFSYLRYIPRFLFKRGLPLQLIFFVTSKCNLRCRHCFYWQEINAEGRADLTLEEIKRFAGNSKLNLLWLSLTGGEPFLRTDLTEIVSAFCQSGKILNISIPTNGQLKRQIISETKKILNNCPGTYLSLSVSLDGMEKTHDSIRCQKGAFARAVDTFQELKKLKTISNFGLSIQTVVTAENQKEIKSLYQFSRDVLKPDFFNLNLIRGQPKDKSQKKIDIRFYEEVLELIKKDVEKGNWPYFDFPFSKFALARNFLVYKAVVETYKKNRFILPCYSLNLSGVISEKGDVFPCEIMENSKLGNLKEVDYNLSKIWYSPRSEMVRKQIKQKCFCTYECALSVNTLFNPLFYITNAVCPSF